MGRGAFDEVSQHVVVLDLQRRNPRVRDKLLLHTGNHAAAFVAQLARGVEVGVMAGGDETAVAHHQRGLGHQGVIQQVDEVAMTLQPFGGFAQQVGQILLRQGLVQSLSFDQTVADRGKVAGAAAVKRQAR